MTNKVRVPFLDRAFWATHHERVRASESLRAVGALEWHLARVETLVSGMVTITKEASHFRGGSDLYGTVKRKWRGVNSHLTRVSQREKCLPQ